MQSITVREFQKEDAEQLADWLTKNAEKNAVNPAVLGYKATKILRAENGSKVLGYLPVQNCFVLDSFAPNPEASDGELAAALEKIVTIVVWETRQSGRGEILFLASDDKVAEFAEGRGFKEVPMKLYRLMAG